MGRTSKFSRIEKLAGRPIGEVLVDLLNEMGSVERVAQHLGISYRHVYRVVKESGIEKRSRYVIAERGNGRTVEAERRAGRAS